MFRRLSLNESVQSRINRLDQARHKLAVLACHRLTYNFQELDRGSVPEDDVPMKLNDLCKLCGTNKLIPDSLKLRDDGTEPLEATEYIHPAQIFRSTFKGKKVAVKVIRLYVPLRIDEPLAVSTPASPILPVGDSLIN